jgi:hypothetical protein
MAKIPLLVTAPAIRLAANAAQKFCSISARFACAAGACRRARAAGKL